MAFETAHALLVGIGSYAHAPRLNVPVTAADANAVASVLRDPQYCGYPREQVTLLSGADATREGVLVALDTLAARAGEGDTVLVFYAGHGEYGDDGYYLTTHDTRLEGRKVAAGTGLREAELIAKLRAIKAKRLLLIVNACHAGEISPVLSPGEAPPTGAPTRGATMPLILDGLTTLAVGCFPCGSTPEGVLDLAGNVWEWIRSEYRAYPYDPGDGREDGADPARKGFTLRGGSWYAPPIVLRAASRNLLSPDFHGDDIGFRLARHSQWPQCAQRITTARPSVH